VCLFVDVSLFTERQRERGQRGHRGDPAGGGRSLRRRAHRCGVVTVTGRLEDADDGARGARQHARHGNRLPPGGGAGDDTPTCLTSYHCTCLTPHHLPDCLHSPVCLSTCLSLYLSVSLPSVSLPICLSTRLSLYPSVSLSVCLSTRLSLYLSVSLSVCLSTCLSLYPSVSLPICLSTRLSLYLSVSLPVCLSTRLPLYLSAVPVCLSTSASLPVCLSACLLYLSASLPVCLSTCLPLYLSAVPVCFSTCLSSSCSEWTAGFRCALKARCRRRQQSWKLQPRNTTR